jgi:aspartate kinase
MMKELTLRTRDYLVSFGECMSTRIFAALLNKIGVKARQVHSSALHFGWPSVFFKYVLFT